MSSMYQVAEAVKTASQPQRAGLLMETYLMTARNIATIIRNPAAALPSIFISVFFLVIYDSTLGDAAGFLPGLSEAQYLAFILPLSVISGALTSAGIAGQNLVEDIESGYFDKLLLTPVSRGALVLGPIIAGALLLGVQTLIIVGVGVLMGLESETGIPGILAVIGLSMLTGMGFAGFSVGMALRTGNAAATQSAGFIFFPLTFLTASFVPLELLDGWLKTAAYLNPITYLLEASRDLLIVGWEADSMIQGLLACGIMAVITYAFALTSLRARTSRS